MNAPTEADLRAALTAHLRREDYASSGEWISYLSDGLIEFYRADDPDDTRLDPDLDAMIQAAVPGITAECQALAMDRLVTIAQEYAGRDPVTA